MSITGVVCDTGESVPRPELVANEVDLAEVTLNALMALYHANDTNPRLFIFGDTPVRVERHPDDERPIVRALTVDRVINELAECIKWVKVLKTDSTKKSTKPALPPLAVARNILASPVLLLPPLDRIVEVPVFGREGTLCHKPGYDEGARIFFAPPDDCQYIVVPDDPTDADVAAARTLICEELLGDFPFVGQAERAHAVAALMLPFARDLIPGSTPLHVIEKPTAGTGATLLADVLMRPALGRPLPVMAAGRDAEEWRKRMTAVLMSGPVAVLLDNIRSLESEAFAAVLTSSIWRDRPLGSSSIVELPVRAVWIATANNPAFTFEIVRRTVQIRLDAGTARPWMRNGFKHPDLIDWTMVHRHELIRAALTFVQAWIARGRPVGHHPRLGTFEAWSDVMGGILEAAGISGFLENLVNFYETVTDDETQACHALIEAWWKKHAQAVVGVQEIWQLTQGTDGIAIDLGDKSERSQRTKLGKLLGRMRDRIFDGRRVTAEKPLHGAQQWRLLPAPDSTVAAVLTSGAAQKELSW